MTRLFSSSIRYYITRDSEDSLWYIRDRSTGNLLEEDGLPIGFILPSEAEDWISAHKQPGWGARKEKP